MKEFWLGILLPPALTAGVAVVGALLKRAALYRRCYNLGRKLRELGLGYDIPLLTGTAEQDLRERVLSTLSDAVRGLARGLAGKPENESGDS